MKKLNNTQRMIVSIILPLILFIVSLAIANNIGYHIVGVGTYSHIIHGGKPFAINDTWYIWVIYLAIIGYFEYKIWDQ
ncbi:MAG TPA: hypothetical protein VE912_10770 [Bacteroidales bacterium]|nr:hypothetical protein [Balneolales bacterium]HYX07203.1 hypothetical protein [Bacteroidales bacterium]